MAIARVITESVLGRHKLAFDEHAIQRMIERNVTEDEVIESLNHPDVTGLPVIYEEEPTRIVVISVARSVKK